MADVPTVASLWCRARESKKRANMILNAKATNPSVWLTPYYHKGRFLFKLFLLFRS